METNPEVILLQEKILSLKRAWRGWIKQLKHLILSKLRERKVNTEMLQQHIVDIVKEIAIEHIGGFNSSAALAALQVHSRIVVAQTRLNVILGNVPVVTQKV